jgi:hypothetical protein
VSVIARCIVHAAGGALFGAAVGHMPGWWGTLASTCAGCVYGRVMARTGCDLSDFITIAGSCWIAFGIVAVYVRMYIL